MANPTLYLASNDGLNNGRIVVLDATSFSTLAAFTDNMVGATIPNVRYDKTIDRLFVPLTGLAEYIYWDNPRGSHTPGTRALSGGDRPCEVSWAQAEIYVGGSTTAQAVVVQGDSSGIASNLTLTDLSSVADTGYSLAIDQVKNQLWVVGLNQLNSGAGTPTIYCIDIATRAVLMRFLSHNTSGLPTRSCVFAFDPANNRAYVGEPTTGNSNLKVTVVDTAAHSVVTSWTITGISFDLFAPFGFDTKRGRLLAGQNVLDPATGTSIAGLTIDSSGSWAHGAGAWYDIVNDRYLYWLGDTGKVYTVDPVAFGVTLRTTITNALQHFDSSHGSAHGGSQSDFFSDGPTPPAGTPGTNSKSGAYHIYQTTPVPSGGLTPGFLLQPAGIALEGALGDMKDAIADRAKLAVRARMPLLAPPDALAQIGLERQIQRGPSETDAQYAVRCQNVWKTWPYAATNYGLLLALYNLGYTNVYVLAGRGVTATLNADQSGVVTGAEIGGCWTIDSNSQPALPAWPASTLVTAGKKYFPPTANGRWYIVQFGGTTGATPPSFPTTVGATVNDNGVIWCCAGVDFWSRFDLLFNPVPTSWNPTPPASNSDEINRIRTAIAQWKPAYATCNRIIALVSGKIWGFPTSQVWGAGTGVWGAPNVTYYTP